ncbi:NAD(P)-binding domain-containing protein [Raoultibacter phocaeensis]|uniref:NAD(P)-binding domain-containing protein n=1 Tax=Raoultibacter phocaeensis TaxID=2479841 RepID=UPI001117B1A4|nr:NAD(P)-binding domain-containing protein [Raoultibacter phocaeensis]
MGKTFVYAGDTAIGAVLADNLVKAGYKAASGISDADVVFTFCATQTDLEDVYFDTEGLVQTAQKGAFLVDLSPSTPGFARELNAVSIVSELAAIEAPLAVRDVTVEHAYSDPENLICFVAGEEGDVAEILPMLKALAATVEPTGASGSAQLARAALTLNTALQLVSVMEADALCRASGASSSGAFRFAREQGFVTESAARLYAAVAEKRFVGEYTVRVCMAELTAALMAADDIDLILPGAEAGLHLLELLAIIGGTDMAVSSLSLVYGEESACAAQGLDWTRAEQAYGDGEADEDECDCGGHHHLDEYSGGFGGYSAN